jgi:flagellar hook-length control protein FliK
MANKAGQAEMRIGLNTAEFGSVEVRTTVHANEVGLQIGSEKGDLRSLLTPELPGIASTLQQQDLRVTQVSFHQQGFAFANNSSSFSGGNSQPRSFDWRPQPTVGASEESLSPEPTHAPEPAVSQRRRGLSILA